MEMLLQRLWDQFCFMTKKIDVFICDKPIDKEPFKSLSELVDDTEEMAQLRSELYDVGIQNVAGFRYPLSSDNALAGKVKHG